MKRVGLITFHAAHNNGSFLQAYALQKYLNKSEKCNCEIINYISPQQNELYAIWKKNRSARNVLKNIYTLFHRKLIVRRYHDFEKIQQKLLLSDIEYNTLEELEETNDIYDVFLSGSDQIWNMEAWDYSDAYFLSFVKNKSKNSYASSFGGFINHLNGERKTKIQRFLSDYKNISVRENIGKELVESLVDNQVKVVVDPTLLLDKKDYETICSKRIIEEEYIFLYSIFAIKYDQSVIDIAKKYSHIYNLPVYVVFTGNKTFRVKKEGIRIVKEAAPDHFLSMIKYASLVLSSSFHGSIFSIIFEKDFYVINGVKNNRVMKDARMNTILTSLGLESRQISILSDEDDYKQTKINYDIVNQNRNDLVKESKEYLKDVLGE